MDEQLRPTTAATGHVAGYWWRGGGRRGGRGRVGGRQGVHEWGAACVRTRPPAPCPEKENPTVAHIQTPAGSRRSGRSPRPWRTASRARFGRWEGSCGGAGGGGVMMEASSQGGGPWSLAGITLEAWDHVPAPTRCTARAARPAHVMLVTAFWLSSYMVTGVPLKLPVAMEHSPVTGMIWPTRSHTGGSLHVMGTSLQAGQPGAASKGRGDACASGVRHQPARSLGSPTNTWPRALHRTAANAHVARRRVSEYHRCTAQVP